MDQQLDVIGDGMQYLDFRHINYWRDFHLWYAGTRRRIREHKDGTQGPDLCVTLFEDAVVVGGMMMRATMSAGMTMDDSSVVPSAPAFMHVHRPGEWNPRHGGRQRNPGEPRQGHDGVILNDSTACHN